MFLTLFSRFFIWEGSKIIEMGRCGPCMPMFLFAFRLAFAISSKTVRTFPVAVFLWDL